MSDPRKLTLSDPAHLAALSDDEFSAEAVHLAAALLADAQRRETPSEHAHAAKVARLMADPRGMAMTVALTDQVFRSERHPRIASQLRYLLDRYGVPHYLGAADYAAMWFGGLLAETLPDLVVPAVVARLREETSTVILPGDDEALDAHLARRRAEGITLILNQLGEAILGEEEAARRLQAYVGLLERPGVEYISVKISSVLSQINLLAFDHTVDLIRQRLRVLYRAAIAASPTAPKFVNLDMEEYRDLHLTVAAFRQTLDEPEFRNLHAGIVLQAYLPDAHAVQRDLTAWALSRVACGGAPIKIRVVKGANLAMERIEAAQHGWELAPWHTRAGTDANYLRMIDYGLQPEHARAVHIGVASHNLFDLAWALLTRACRGVEQCSEFEMLEGMANPQALAVKDAAGHLLLYAPVARAEDFHSAISYLLRRLDENTAPGNFLHDLFGLHEGAAPWDNQKAAFLAALRERHNLPAGPQRSQNRHAEHRRFVEAAGFENEPDTDWSLPANQAWIKELAVQWRDAVIDPVPLADADSFAIATDPSIPGRESYRYALGSLRHVEAALDAAVAARHAWSATTPDHRARLLRRSAEALAERRGQLIGAMMRDTGKAAAEADPEVSEAIDFANYYSRAFDALDTTASRPSPLGTILVTPPWNFPLAIPAGGVFAALMAGNAVILKPALEAVLTGWHLANALWDAGIPRDVLQFLAVPDDATGRALVTDPRISAVILTGAYDTARLFLAWKPELRLIAETSGKNAIIVTALSDRDQAIRDIVRSAFGHAGQKCSAASLAILEAEVYDSPAFRARLRDAAASLTVGPAYDLASMVTPVIREPGEALLRGLTRLDEGEEWLLEPRIVAGNPQLWSPGIRLGVRRGSWFHRTECFGPVLGLMRAADLGEAIGIANDSALGLTAGLESLDDREIELWTERIEAGNLYVNRGITGAIVQRQPFGGWKRSVFGTAKAGGPNYALNLCAWQDCGGAPDDYQSAWNHHFSREHDPSGVPGESNIFRYRPIRNVLIRIASQDEAASGLLALKAARICAVPAALSTVPGVRLDEPEAIAEDEARFIARIGAYERLRLFGPASGAVFEAAHAAHTHIVDAPVTRCGRLELRHYLREQAVARTTHRYGALPAAKTPDR